MPDALDDFVKVACAALDEQPFTPSAVPKAALKTAVRNIARDGELCAALLYGMFEGVPVAPEVLAVLGNTSLTHVSAFPNRLPQDTRDMLQGMLGVATAVGQMADIMHSAFDEGELSNDEIKEAARNILIYLAPILRALRTDLRNECGHMLNQLLADIPGQRNRALDNDNEPA